MEERLTCDINSFLDNLFRQPPTPPFSFRLAFEGLPAGQLHNILGDILIKGASIRYNRQLHELSDREMQTMREYLHSIGWDAVYNIVKRSKTVLDYHPDGTPYMRVFPLNNVQMTFQPASPSLRPVGGTCM